MFDTKPVRAPFPDVAVHVVEAEGVGLPRPDGVGGVARVAPMPGVLGKGFGIVAVGVGCGGSRPAGEFPFGLGRQDVLPTVGQATGGLLD